MLHRNLLCRWAFAHYDSEKRSVSIFVLPAMVKYLMIIRMKWPLLAFILFFSLPAAASAQGKATPGASSSSVQLPEAAEMFLAIARGSDMGPGGGWFHPGQSRFSWQWLKKQCKRDDAGVIRQKDFPGPAELFERLDRNHDGTLTQADFDWSERSPYFKEAQPSSSWFRTADKNSNGKISRAEWLEVFDRAAKGKDFLSPDDLREAFPLSPPRQLNAPAAPTGGDPSSLTLAKGVFSGELGSVFEGPRVGQRAPDFTLATVDGKSSVRLADHLGKKPVVLIFGSFT
jgi:hypothetical protein